MARREELGHPLGLVPPLAPPPPAAPGPSDAAPRAFVLEIGCEELPPDDVASALEQLRERVPALLARLRLAHGAAVVEGTPRRLVVMVEGLAGRTTAEELKARALFLFVGLGGGGGGAAAAPQLPAARSLSLAHVLTPP